MAQQIAIFGKGGVGKTTITANLSAALAEADFRVLLVGCSPTADTSYLLVGEESPTTLCDYLLAEEVPSTLIARGYRGVGCVEIGELPYHELCASRKVAESLQRLHQLDVIQEYMPDYVIYDIPEHISCSGSIILGDTAIDTAILVASADFQSMFTVNRIIKVLSCNMRSMAFALIANGNVSSFEDSLVTDYAKLVGLRVAASIPRSMVVRHSELYGKTVIEAAPLSTHAYAYRRLAKMVAERNLTIHGNELNPLTAFELKQWARRWGERLGELEYGIIQDGAGI